MEHLATSCVILVQKYDSVYYILIRLSVSDAPNSRITYECIDDTS